ncbi:MAG: aminotransferase class I/II-fold pyridoxal phosphate-dependent enzyme [Myxococcota bacterium]
MQHTERRLRILDTVVSNAVRGGLGQQIAEDEFLNGRTIRLGGRDVVQFASCSYLGLETDPRLRSGTVDAVHRYGTQFSSSRVYVSAPPYRELEALLEEIFEAPVIATPSTTLGHLCAIPTLIDERDAVLLDHQVHNSVQTATTQVVALGARIEMLRHNQLDQVEEHVAELAPAHRNVWYMIDGVYSMYGDVAPFSGIEALLDRYENLHLYVDDAHGMSWSGRCGRGVALDRMSLHPRMVMATSMNKAFAAGGGVLVFPDPEIRRKVRTCGGPLLFSGPIQPPMLGAAIASAKLHLSAEIGDMQQRLRERMALCHELLSGLDVPLRSTGESPIQFVGMGLTRVAQNMTRRLLDEGFYTNVGQFPAVPMKGAGVRFTLTLHQTEEDIRALVDAIAHHFAPALEEEGQSEESAWRAFGRRPAEAGGRASARPSGRASLRLEREETIDKIPADGWDPFLGDRGSFDVAGLRFLERCFPSDGSDPRNAWSFRYYRVLDDAGRVRLATFATEALWKADMLAPAAVSREVEERRRSDPDYLTMRTLSLGSLLTEGDHLHLDRSRGDWQDALSLLLEALTADAESSDAELIALRDLPAADAELEAFLDRQGYLRMPAPDRLEVEIDWHDEAEFLAKLSRNARRHQRRDVQPWNAAYDVEILEHGGRRPDPAELEVWHSLYRQVRARSLELNTFELPGDLFEQMLQAPGWEIALFRLRPEFGGAKGADPVGLVATCVGREHTVPTVLGLDDRFVRSHGLYRQCLRHTLVRASELGRRRVCLGFGAAFEKRRFGAREIESSLYVQIRDNYPFDVIDQLGQGGAR